MRMAALFLWSAGLLFGAASWAVADIEDPDTGTTSAEAAVTWRLKPLPEHWRADPDGISSAERPVWMHHIDGADDAAPSADPWYCRRAGNGLRFGVVGRVPVLRRMLWRASLKGVSIDPQTDHFVLRYRARGLARHREPFAVLALERSGTEGQGQSIALLDAGQVRNDGRWHTVLGRIDVPVAPTALKADLTTHDSNAWLEIDRVVLYRGMPRIAPEWGHVPQSGEVDLQNLVPVDLSALCNGSWARLMERQLERRGAVIDGGWPPEHHGVLQTGGLPWKLGPADRNLIEPEEHPEVNNEAVTFVGVRIGRRYMEPVARDDRIEIPISRRASELFLLLLAEQPNSHQPHASAKRPPDYTDVGAFHVQLRYADGSDEIAFPFSIADRGYALHRVCGVYAVSADEDRQLSQLVIHNRVFGRTVAVAAVTLNVGRRRLLPQLRSEPPVVRVPPHDLPPPAPVNVEQLLGKRIRLSNRYYSVTVALENGLGLAELENRWAKIPLAVAPGSGIEIVEGNTTYTGRTFVVEQTSLAPDGATVTLRGPKRLPLKLELAFRIDDSPQLRIDSRVTNMGKKPLSVSVRLPVLRNLVIGRASDTWVFFPQYRTVITNEPGTWISGNDLRFPVQFVDIFNPPCGIGLALLTRNRVNRPLEYGMAKCRNGASACVALPAEFGLLQPGESRELSPSTLFFHNGDWHTVLHTYRRWLATWCRPYRADRRQWFRELFLVRTHLTRKFYNWTIPIYDETAGTYRIDAFLRRDAEYLGTLPEMLHLFGWCDLDNGWQGHPNGDYDPQGYTGGKRVLADMVRRVQQHYGIPVSLYTISDRCYRHSRFGRQFGERLARVGPDGAVVADQWNYYLCPNATQWHDHYAEALKRTQQETGVKVLYLDVLGYQQTKACYSAEHGHPVPSDPNEGCLHLLRELRSRLPDDVVLWSEYPVNDVAVGLLDGYIHYYCLNWHDHFSKWYDRREGPADTAPLPQTICRYAFPWTKTLVFPCGANKWSSESRFPFFNGEALYDTSWSLYPGEHLDRMRKSLAIQMAYRDCFSTLDPEPLVPTERAGVYANRFPGNSRTVWTLYNSRFRTVRGTVLRIPHRKGATYRDLWNGNEIQPALDRGMALIELELPPQGLGCVVQLFAATE